MATDKQINYIKNLCDKKGVEYSEQFIISQKTITAVIEKLKTIADIVKVIEPSESQLTLIDQYAETLGITVDKEGLTGEKGGSASQLIQELKEKVGKEKENLHTIIPATPKQKELIKNMQISVDIYAETGYTMTNEDIEGLNISEASEYLGKYLTTYYNWQRNCPTESQIEQIQKALDKLESPMEYETIINIPKRMASRYIEQLYKELNDRIWKEWTLEPEEMRGIKTMEDSKNTKEEISQKTIIHSLYASIGQEAEVESLSWIDFLELADFVAETLGQNLSDVLITCENMVDELCSLKSIFEKGL